MFATKSIAACTLMLCGTALFAQPMVVPRDTPQNVAQLSASGSVEVEQEIRIINKQHQKH